ncbi:MAG: cytochrome C oxidase subunit IV family protein [Actinomycetota bacterium]|nr:cytochrome C oxidase subunit IV family protein [Actinomycetota bacterium]
MAEEEHPEHPGEKQYVKVAIALAILTAIEVAVFYIPPLRGILVPLLATMMLAKFLLVIGYFMHLKFDSKIFRGLFVVGLVLALGVFAVALWTFTFAVTDTPAAALGP